MATFFRYRPLLTGWIGGPGINTWHGAEGSQFDPLDSPQEFASSVAAVYIELRGYLVSGLQVVFPAEMTEHDVETGRLVSVRVITPPSTVTSTVTTTQGALPRSAQIVVRHLTDTVSTGARVAGRHFIGPTPNSSFGTDGRVTAGTIANVAAAYGGVLDAPGMPLAVWGPPKDATPSTPARGGVLARVVTVQVSPTPGTLRSRKV